ncbi:hypothetical protein D9M72_634430 [compost metagenome]
MTKFFWHGLVIGDVYCVPDKPFLPAKNAHASCMPPPTCELFELSRWRSMLLMY